MTRDDAESVNAARVDRAVETLLRRAALSSSSAAATRRQLLRSPRPFADAEEAGPRASAPTLGSALRSARVLPRLLTTAFVHALQLALLIIAWWLVGSRVVGTQSPTATGWITTWIGIGVLVIGLRALASVVTGRLAVDAGAAIRERLLQGILALDPEPIRRQGIGQLLGRVIEVEALESLALSGGLLGLAALFEIVTGVVVLVLAGGGAAVEIALLAAWLVVTLWLGGRYWGRLQLWAADRLALTHDLVERMVGHRTLVAQETADRRALPDEDTLSRYASRGAAVDRSAALLAVVVPRGWVILGVAGLLPVTVMGGDAVSVGAVATSLGGVLFIYGAFRKLVIALPSLAGAAVAWRQVAPLFRSSEATGGAGAATTTETEPRGAGPALVSADGLRFSYRGRAVPVLADCSFALQRGDRVVLEGASGGGKSTFASLLTGLRRPDAGALFLDGVPQTALGLDRWRAHVGAVPQFHENHMFSATLLFNLLMGRRWPPTLEDVREAEQVCAELDLGPLLARMPAGLQQQVGETGWQLSHGERSRIFIARSLLQTLDARVLDESFAALDPESMTKVMSCVMRRAQTVVVIAHP